MGERGCTKEAFMTIEQFIIGFLREAAFDAWSTNPSLGCNSAEIRFLLESQFYVPEEDA